MKFYVLDASVILAFLIGNDSLTEKKLTKILNEAKNCRAELHSSCLLPLEVANGLRYSLSDEDLANEVFQKFSDLPINYSAFTLPQMTKALRLSYLYGVSVYDASYHLLAKLLKATFLTGDAKYFKKAKELGSIEVL